MKRLFALCLAFGSLCGSPAWSQAPHTSPMLTSTVLTSPIGVWRTIDDKSGEIRGAIRLFETNGVLYGRIERVYDKRAIGQVCDKCTGDRHDKPILGLDVIRGLRPDGPGAWSGGEILDPETGDTYRVSLHLDDGGRKLIVRGSILGGLIGRSQTWLREMP